MLTTFGRQLGMVIALAGLVALLSLFFLTSQGRPLALRGSVSIGVTSRKVTVT